MSLLSLLPKPPRVLALGEPTHGEDTLLEARNDLFRELVEQHGYRTIALESDCLRGLLVDDYVTSGRGDLDDVMERGFSHGFGASPANRALVEWMRACNEGLGRVRFAGFDGPLETAFGVSPRPVLTWLGDYLECPEDLPGDDERWTNPAVMRDPAQGVGRSPEADRLRLRADDLMALVEANAPQLIADSSREEWERARLYGRTAAGLLRYHAAMADTSPGRIGRVLTARASMMAANLLALAARGPVLVHAGNGHLQRPKSSMSMGGGPVGWWSAGAIVGAQLGDDYAFVATALGTIRHRGVDEPGPGTPEGLLSARPGDRFLTDPGSLTGVPLEARVSPWFGYAPLDPAHLPALDGILFVRDAVEGERWWPPA